MECGGAGPAARGEDEGGQMVAFELEAAEALAGLARCSSLRGFASGSGSGELEQQLVVEAVVTSAAAQSQDQPVATEQVCEYAPTTSRSPEKTEKIAENIPCQLCSTSCQPNPVTKSRRKLTEAEKEERKLRRILANRESARQTIRRRQHFVFWICCLQISTYVHIHIIQIEVWKKLRIPSEFQHKARETNTQTHSDTSLKQAMYLELTRKAADALEENENLKKRKGLAVEKYNYLKGRNEFLKAQLAEAKKAEAGEMEEEPKTSEAEKSCSVTTTSTPIFLHNQPSVVPCFWPSVLPSSDVFPFQCASHSHDTSSSQFLMPQGDISCQNQRREHSIGNARPGTPLFVVPLPWLLPLLAHSSTLHSQSGTSNGTNTNQCSKCSCSDTQPNEGDNQLSNQNTKAVASNAAKAMPADSVHGAGLTLPPDSSGRYNTHQPASAIVVPGLLSPVRHLETLGPPRRSCHIDYTSDVNAASAPESRRRGLCRRNQESIFCPPKRPEGVFAATEARRRRKELMKLKDVHCHDVRTY